MLGAALTVGVSPVEAKEIVYQAVPYVGMGKVFDFIHHRGVLIAVATQLLPFIGYPAPSTHSPRSTRSRPPQHRERRTARAREPCPYSAKQIAS
jgi:hypothetical protein